MHAVPVDAPGREVAVGADESVVMASVYKLPLLVAMCERFADGSLDPRSAVRVHPGVKFAGADRGGGVLDPVTLSWRDLAASMITVSDNAAADIIFGEVGLDAALTVSAYDPAYAGATTAREMTALLSSRSLGRHRSRCRCSRSRPVPTRRCPRWARRSGSARGWR